MPILQKNKERQNNWKLDKKSKENDERAATGTKDKDSLRTRKAAEK